MQTLVSQLKATFPDLRFRDDDQFCWSPETGEVVYDRTAKGAKANWALLHETSHALLNHRSYSSDFTLVTMEVAAWDYAQRLAKQLKLDSIDENHIQDCLDTYRDWLHKRCLCPQCGTRSLQKNSRQYNCYNCTANWSVTPSRFCRVYRLTSPVNHTSLLF